MNVVNDRCNEVIMNAFDHWRNNIADNGKRIDFRTWLKVKYNVYLDRDWSLIRFETPNDEVIFTLRFS